MDCQDEFYFFLQVIHRAGIGSKEFSLPAAGDLEIDGGLRRQLGVEPSVFAGCRVFLPLLEPGILCHVTDCFYLHYLFFRLPGAPRGMVVGPYLSLLPSAQQILEMAERYELPPVRTHLLEEFYPTLPQITDNSVFYSMVYCLCEALYGRKAEVRSISLEDELSPTALSATAREADLSTAMQRLENRYQLEDQLLRAVAEGDRARLRRILHGVDLDVATEPRLSDPVRNIKNYCIVLNTLLRKAAQQGGVHPIYLDDLSRTFAARIEKLPTTASARQLVHEMADQYCLLVQQHGAENYSRPVQTAMLYVRQHLAEPLNLHTLAALLGCNASYFSARFKRETGQTLTEFILQERMRLAVHLLLTTRLQVQTVAQYCGFLDANYFCRIFRQTVGCSPGAYRKTGRALQV